MKRLMKKLEDIMVAVTFAEAGEFDEASRHLGDSSQDDIIQPQEGFKKPVLQNAGK